MPTYSEVAGRQLASVCRALGLGSAMTERHLALQELLFQPWGDELVPEHAAFASHIGDDHSPYEYSLALTSKDYELRLLVEPQSSEPSLLANRSTGVALVRRLTSRFQLDSSRFERVAPLFFPERPEPPFSIWVGASFPRFGAPELKVYFNPRARGAEHARKLVGEALQALELEAAERVIDAVARRGEDLDEVKYFSLDLSANEAARVKIYVCHHRAKALELERAFSIAPSHRAGDVAGYCSAVLGRSGPFIAKPVSSCLAFVRGRPAPLSITLHVPIAHYLSESATVARTVEYLERNGIAARPYLRAWTALGGERRSARSALQSYLSFRREPSGIRVTTYLSPCLFGEQKR